MAEYIPGEHVFIIEEGEELNILYENNKLQLYQIGDQRPIFEIAIDHSEMIYLMSRFLEDRTRQ